MQIFGDLTELQQGKLLVAQYKRKQIQFWNGYRWVNRTKMDEKTPFGPSDKYRVVPEPEVRVNTHNILCEGRYYKVRYNIIDNVANTRSVTMEKL